VRGGGEVEIPEATRLKLEIEVEAACKQTYSSALSRLDTLVMSAAPYTHVVYDIQWYEQVFASTVAFSSGGNVYEVPYVYKLQVPKLSNSRGIICPDVLVESTSSGSAVAQTGTATESPVNSEYTGGTYDCIGVVSSSRPVLQQGTGVACWLKLEDGSAARLVFNDVAQITYRTVSSGSDIYFKIVNAGDELGDVLGATIRPEPFVLYGYGGFEEVRDFEINYHTMSSGWAACLRDANNEFQPMTSFCN
jgi:hypothetical protein